MSVHQVRLFHSEAGAGGFHDWLETWLTNMTPRSADEVTNEPPTLTTPIDGGAPYYSGDLAFAWSEDKNIIMDQLTGYLDAYCEWWRLGYHVCSHDEENPTPCAWEDGDEGGAVPNHVRTLGVA